MKREQKTTAEVQAAIFEREHRKSPLRGGAKLTLKKARELALQEFGTAKGIQQEENALPDYYIMRLGNMRVRIAPDTYGGTGCILIEVRLSGYGAPFSFTIRKPCKKTSRQKNRGCEKNGAKPCKIGLEQTGLKRAAQRSKRYGTGREA